MIRGCHRRRRICLHRVCLAPVLLQLEQIWRKDPGHELILFRHIPDPDLWHHRLAAHLLRLPQQVSCSLGLFFLLEVVERLAQLDLVQARLLVRLVVV